MDSPMHQLLIKLLVAIANDAGGEAGFGALTAMVAGRRNSALLVISVGCCHPTEAFLQDWYGWGLGR
jgi:hypothetical protein